MEVSLWNKLSPFNLLLSGGGLHEQLYYDHCRISEERFWHNYFYRVFLIKQSSQLSTLASGREHPLSCNTLDAAL